MSEEEINSILLRIRKRKESIRSNKILNADDLLFEKQVLGHMINSKIILCELIDDVYEGFFINEINQKVIWAIQVIFGISKPLNLATFSKELTKSSDFDELESLAYLIELLNCTTIDNK